jgi:NADPH2:quinone reductase
MQALVATGQPNKLLGFRNVPEPKPSAHHAVIEVAAVSLNRGELHRLTAAQDGWRPGWDVVGTVVADSDEGSGLEVGDRVVALAADGGAWAERVAVATDNVAVLPPTVDLRAASALPTAGITALRTLRRGGLLLEKRVLVTGATGGVGAFAVALARLSGARVTAVAALRDRGDHPSSDQGVHIIEDINDAQERTYDLVLESVGGESLRGAISAVRSGGSVITFGNSSKQQTNFSTNDFYPQNRARIEGYFLFGDVLENPVREDLSLLVSLVEQGRLRPMIGAEAPWTSWEEVLDSLLNRTLDGKAVLMVGSDQ